MLIEPEPSGGAQPEVAEQPAVADIAAILQALADPIRLSIVRTLAACDGEQSCGSFDLAVTKATMTHHFRTLREAGLIGHRMVGTRKLIHLRRADVDAAYPGLLDSVLQRRRAPLPGG